MSTKKLLVPILTRMNGPFTFGKFMRVARTSLDITQVQMSKKLGIAKGTLCDIEKGRQLVSVTFAIKVARKAGLSQDLAVESCLQDQVNKAKLRRRVQLIA